jgi:tripartite-type tricarboxylate transporter receptor subunit TctC
MVRIILVALALQCAAANAQNFPSKPLRIFVPYAAGGLIDLTARQIASSLGEELGQSVVVENRTGASSGVAVEALKAAPADGYTMLVDNSGIVINTALNPKLPYYYARDLAPVSIVTGSSSLLAVNSAVPARDLKELIALARAKPGTLNYSSAGVGTILHMSGEMLKSMAKVDIVHVPYKGGSAAMNDVVSGRIHMIFLGPSILAPFLREGRIRALASTGPKRVPGYPDVPTIAESGFPDYDSVSWIGVFVARATPPETLARLSKAAIGMLNRSEFKAFLAKNSSEPIGATGDEARRFLEAEERRWGSVIKANNIRVE